MKTQLSEQLRELIDDGTAPVSAAEIVGLVPQITGTPLRGADLARRAARRGRGVRLAAAAAGVAAIASAAAVAAAQLGAFSGAEPGHPLGHHASHAGAVVAAAVVRRVASASGAALAQSGKVVIRYRTAGAALRNYGTDDISFSGQNYNFAGHVTTPAAHGAPASSESYINRVVNGRAYDYFVASRGLRWYHVTGPTAVASLHIPDPRTLLAVLRPDARFVAAGWRRIGGIRLEHLRATVLSGLGFLTKLPEVQPGEHVTALSVWVDSSGVVRRMDVSLRTEIRVWSIKLVRHGRVAEFVSLGRKPGTRIVRTLTRRMKAKVIARMRRDGMTERMELARTTLAISFVDIGRPQAITVPPHAITVAGHG
jgi:hypothetical protein